MGSFIFRSSPGCLDHARDVPREGPITEADPAQPELSQHAAGPAANAAPPHLSARKLRLPIRLDSHGSPCHRYSLPDLANGIPNSRRRARAESSRPAVVTIVTLRP